jgi:hypothetical protein
MTTYCSICNQKIEFRPFRSRPTRKYCSLACAAISKRGKKPNYSDEAAWRAALSRAGKGRKQTPEHIRNNANARRGVPQPWVSERNKRWRGANSPSWKGGISAKNAALRSTEELREWRKAVFVEDNFKCRKCGASRVPINADHIKPFSLFPDIRFDISNGQTLCVPCHKEKTKVDRKIYDNYKGSVILQDTS